MAPQTIRTPAGEELVVLTRTEYDALVAAADSATDVAAYDAAVSNRGGADPLPFDVTQFMLKGASLLRALRLWRGETQLDLAAKTETSQGFISDIENRRRSITPEMAGKLAEALDIPVGWLVR